MIDRSSIGGESDGESPTLGRGFRSPNALESASEHQAVRPLTGRASRVGLSPRDRGARRYGRYAAVEEHC